MPNRISELRRAAGLTQRALAAEIGATERQIGYWEGGGVSLDDAARVADALGVSLDDLAGRQAPLGDAESALVFAYRELGDARGVSLLDYAQYLLMKLEDGDGVADIENSGRHAAAAATSPAIHEGKLPPGPLIAGSEPFT